MTDRCTIVQSPGVGCAVRRAMRRSPLFRVDDVMPTGIADLLAELVHAEERHRAQVAAFRARYA